MSAIVNILNRYTTDVETTIQGVLKNAPPFLHGSLSYHFGWVDKTFQTTTNGGGKLLRPTLNLLVYEAITETYQPSLPIAASLEMIHNFSLLHDDVEDNGMERRGRATAWTIWGKSRTINMGDFLLGLAFKALHQLDTNRFDPETIFAVYDIVTQACVCLTEGQEYDMAFETQPNISTDMYLDMISRKTGALIEASVVAGARLATPDETLVNAYRQFGRNLGLAFQIRDDILGIWGDATKTGKSATDDLRNKKKTLPIIYMLNQTSNSYHNQLQAFYQQPNPLTDAEITMVRNALTDVQAEAYTQQVVATYHDKAFSALAQVGIMNEAQTCLEALSRFLVERTY